MNALTFDLYPRLPRHIFAALLGVGAVVGGYFSAPLACLVAAGMLVALCYRYCLSIDPETRTYRLQRGFFPHTGTFVDLQGVNVEITVVTYQGGSNRYFTTSLLWVNGKQKPWILGYQNAYAAAMEEAGRLSDLLTLPILESGPRTVRAMTGRGGK